MYLINLLKLIFNESKVSLNSLLIYIFILSLLLSVGMSLISFSISVPKELETILKSYISDTNFDLTVSWLKRNDIKMLEELNKKDIEVKYSADKSITQNAVIVDADNVSHISSGSVAYLDKGNTFVGVEGLLFKDDTDCEDGLWISDTFSENCGIKTGDTVFFSSQSMTVPIKLVVKGEYSSSKIPDNYIMPFFTAEKFLELNQKTTYFEAIVKVSDIDECEYLYSRLIEKGYGVYNNYYDFIKPVKDDLKFIRTVLYGLTGVVIIATISIAYSLSQMIIIARRRHIGLLKILGVRDNLILWIYFSLIEMILICSMGIGYLGGKLFNYYTESVMKELFDLNGADLSFISESVLFAFVVCNLLLLLVMNGIRKTVRTISPIQIISEKE